MKLFQRIRAGIQRFMWGRYGTDQLNLTILITAMVLSIVGMVLTYINTVCAIIGWSFTLVCYGLLIWGLFRMLSRNLDARRRENRRFLNLTAGLRDRQNKYFRCPKCKQTVRVPRGRGKICIRCPKCSEKFIRKS